MGTRRAVNLSMSVDLLDRAKALNINLSQALEPHLRELVREAEAAAWRRDNRESIEAFNRYIEENGVFGEEWRSW
ncbi:MAG: type II toxin-antitoxin system CcdA family antitoxin [Bauldia sp.]